jgi:hypothetical protein
MGLFVCDECGVVENTALCGDGWWGRKQRKRKRGKALCSECHPEIGKWHGHFERIDADAWDEENPYATRDLLNR